MASLDWLAPEPITPPAEMSSSGSLVAERFQESQLYGDSAWENAWGLLTALQGQTYPVEWSIDPWVAVDSMGLDGLAMNEPTRPEIATIEVEVTPFTDEAPTMPDVDLTAGTPPEFNVTDPGFQIPEAPTVDFPIFDDNAPQVTDADIPTRPTWDLPAVPVLSAVSIPSPPEYNLPDFEGELPTMDITPPEPMFYWNEAEYSSAVKAQLATKILADLISGGSGLDTETEQAIYDRATARQELENNQLYDEAMSFFAARGFRLPPGALAGRLQEAAYKIAQTRTDLNNDILVQQSKLAQENTHFIIDRGIQMEKNLMDYTNQYQQRAFEAAKYVVEAALIIYQAKVEAYKAQLEIYRTQAEVYKARIQAEIAKAELYKAQIEAVKASVDVQRLMIEAYKAQVESVMTLIEVYKAEMEGAKIQAQIDGIRIEGFRALVEVYKARIQAATARYEAYQAQIAGEKARAEMYEAQVRGFAARVDAFKATAEVDISRVQAQVELNKGRVESFKALIERYKAQVDAAIKQAEVEVDIEKLDVAMYEADVKRYESEVEATAKVFLGRVEEAKARADIQVKEAEVAVREAVARYGLVTGSTEAAAKVAAQLAASALSMVSASASLGYQEGRHDSRSAGATVSSSASNSHSSSHIYTHSD